MACPPGYPDWHLTLDLSFQNTCVWSSHPVCDSPSQLSQLRVGGSESEQTLSGGIVLGRHFDPQQGPQHSMPSYAVPRDGPRWLHSALQKPRCRTQCWPHTVKPCRPPGSGLSFSHLPETVLSCTLTLVSPERTRVQSIVSHAERLLLTFAEGACVLHQCIKRVNLLCLIAVGPFSLDLPGEAQWPQMSLLYRAVAEVSAERHWPSGGVTSTGCGGPGGLRLLCCGLS